MESSRDEALIHAYTYWAPIFYALGLTGSIASLITLQSPKFSARIYIYLKALALADLGFLVFAIRLLQLIRNKYHNSGVFLQCKRMDCQLLRQRISVMKIKTLYVSRELAF